MSYPKIKVNKSKLKTNVKSLVKICKEKNMNVAGVTKVFCGEPELAQIYVDGGVKYLADSRIQNLIKLKEFDIQKMILRIPMQSEITEIVKYTDMSFNSEKETIKKISEEAIKQGKIHKIVMMIDLGDLREGYFDEEELLNDAEEIVDYKGIEIEGLAVNMACFGGVIPDESTIERLINLSKRLEKRCDIKLEIVSGGNSATLYLLKDLKTSGMTTMRLGEALILGTEPSNEEQLPGTINDAFTLEVEIIEIKEKPSVPKGKIGKDAFGNIPSFEDKGIRKRMICAIGKQDVDYDTMFPLDKNIEILGGSSDHLILDGTDSNENYKVGDIITFRLEYVSILRAMTSEYVTKEFIE